MELPGERATFWRLQLDLEPSDEVLTLPLFFEATVKRRDERVALVELDVSLTSGGAVCGSGSVAAFVRTDPPHSDRDAGPIAGGCSWTRRKGGARRRRES